MSQLDSFKKLGAVKTADSKGTLLEYVAAAINASGDDVFMELNDLSDDVTECAKLQLAQLNTDITAAASALSMVKTEVRCCRDLYVHCTAVC
jgi:hypothetical protein